MKLIAAATSLLAMSSFSAAFSAITSRNFRNGISNHAARNVASIFTATVYLNKPKATFARGINNRSTGSTFGVRNFSKQSTALSMSEGSETPFTTWTFDEACETMEFNDVASASVSVTDDVSTIDDSDLIILGIYGPAKDSDEEEEEGENGSDDGDAPEPTLVGKAKELDEQVGGALSELMIENYKVFKHGAKAGGKTPTLRVVSSGSKSKRIILFGLGPEGEDIKDDFMTKVGSAIASACHTNKKVKTCSLVLPASFKIDAVPMSDLTAAYYNSLYSDNRYRTGAKVTHIAEDLEAVTIVTEGSVDDISSVNASLEDGKQIATGVFLSKDIVNAPHNVLNSESLANVARRIAEESGVTIKCTILDKEECEKRGMGAYLGVARGSETEPQFIHLTYTPRSGKASKKLGVVGKGLLFDTGGYNIKTAMMELMKFDCGGSAAVLGAARAIGALEPEDVEVHFIVAACENMINDRAVVPSDILTASNGKTIEIINTDAEGRLTLADALVYADKEVGCESIIELSTLTGACMVSLGKKVCGVWTSNDDLAKELEEASKVTGDKSWRMPLVEEYNDQLKSKIADMNNCGTRYGGAITAALFLQNFVDKKKPFAHIDIAGPVWDDKSGATGFGAKLVTEWVSKQGK